MLRKRPAHHIHATYRDATSNQVSLNGEELTEDFPALPEGVTCRGIAAVARSP